MPSIASLTVDLIAETASFRRDLNRAAADARAASGRIQRELAGIGRGFDRLQRAAGAIGLGLAARELVRIGRAALDTAGGLGELAQQMGVSTRFLQEMQYAASQAGVNAQELEAGFGILTAKIGQAAEGNKSLIDAFNDVGVTILDTNGKLKSTEQIFTDLAAGLGNVEDATVRFRIERELLGRSGTKLDTILAGGTKALSEYARAAHELGLVLDEDAIKKADKASDNLVALEQVVQKAFATGIVDSFAGSLQDVDGAAKNAASAAEALGRAVGGVMSGFVDLINFVERNKPLIGLLSGVGVGAAVGGPLGAVGLGATGLIVGLADQADDAKNKIDELNDEIDRLIGQRALVARGGAGAVSQVDAKIAALRVQLAELTTQAKAADDAVGAVTGEKPSAGTNPTPTGGGGDTEGKARAAALDRLRDMVAGYELEAATIGLSSAEREKMVAALKAEDLAREAGLQNAGEYLDAINASIDAAEFADAVYQGVADSEEHWNAIKEEGKRITEEVMTATEKYAAAMQHLGELLRMGAISQETFERKAKELGDTLDANTKKTSVFGEISTDAGHAIGTAFEDAVVSGERLSDVLDALLQDIERILARLLITKPLENAIGTAVNGGQQGNDIFGSLFSLGSSLLSIFGGFYSGAGQGTNGWMSASEMLSFGGAKAAGGPVYPGRAYTVGEEGPETLVPGAAGTIIPAGGGGTVELHQHFSGGPGGDAGFRYSPDQIGRLAVAHLAQSRRIM